ncbi:MAG: 2-dehydropantoate 2-reductase N-terminal domain-containing protein [bacterium]
MNWKDTSDNRSDINTTKNCVIAGFGSIGSFLYFLLKNNQNNVFVYSKRDKLRSYQIIFRNKYRVLGSYVVDEIEALPEKIEIDYLFICTKSYDAVDYLQTLKREYEIQNVVLTQNGIGLENEIAQIFEKNIYYLTLTTALDFEKQNLIVYNPYKSQAILTYVSSSDVKAIDEAFKNFTPKINSKYCHFSFSRDHLSVRFSKLILNLILNVVPASFCLEPWKVYRNNEQAINFEKQLIIEILNLMQVMGLTLYNFKGYNTTLICNFYKYCPLQIFKILYSMDWLVRLLRDYRIPSFYRDLVIYRRRTEVEYYLGWFKYYNKLDLPVVKELYHRIKVIEAKG